MTNDVGHWDYEQQKWVEAAPQPASNSQTLETPTPSPTPTEPTIEEHASMLRQGFEKLVNKAVEGTELAQRVKELEARIENLQFDLNTTRDELKAERVSHNNTQEKLLKVEVDLARRESTVHDLVMERDIALGERNTAQGERDVARYEVKRLQSDVDFLNQRVIDQAHANEVLSERSEMLTRKIATIKAAFATLNE